ncbi:DUF898 family protein [Rhizobium sp. TH2]|uniref:YjgN family protein n=1 Tax=Rhizobium sp. TH2 TaxID=2775403 RepID=UPI00215746D5|nr:DUF898 family protein [Rhizobium sp. TH2]UVC09370.1 DUF898 family protein [Rhizobium sp. TH2]
MAFGTRVEGNLRRAEFRGNAGEYFGIWIVNILLTIITLGIYAAWAKVRRIRYFRGNTFLDGHSFDYHATGLQIFLGWFIAFVVISIINVVTSVYPLLGLVSPIAFMAILPFFIARSLRFNARVSSYRNIRFDFTGKAWGAFVSILLGGLVAVFSFGILAPLASRWSYRYIFNNLRYGDRGFETNPGVGAIYRGWLLPALMVVMGLLLAAAIGWLYVAPFVLDVTNNMDQYSKDEQVGLTIAAIYAVIIPIILVFVVAGIIYRVVVRNVVMNSMLFDKVHPLHSDLSRGGYFWIVLSNFLITVFSLGLMRPWAAVREARYLAEHSGITLKGDVGEVMSSILASGSAFSAEFLEIEGMDFGF